MCAAFNPLEGESTVRLLKYCLLSLIILLFSTAYAQTVPDNLLQTAIRAAQTATGITDLPISWSYVLERTRSSALGCSLVTGTDLGVDVVYYNFTLTFTTSTVNVRVSADAALVVVCDQRANLTPTPTLNVTGAPVGAVTPTPAIPNCVLTPNGGLSNVRSEPSTDRGDATIIAQITLPTPAIGRNADASWFRIANGWVAARVVSTSGNCAGLPLVDETNAGVGQNIVGAPYCTFTTTTQGSAVVSFNPDFVFGFSYNAGASFLVTGQTNSELGMLARVFVDTTTTGWIPMSSGALSEGCAAFLAASPDQPGQDQQCFASINMNAQVVTEPEGVIIAFPVELGDRYAIRNRAEVNGEGWLQITTFGRSPDGWILERNHAYSEGCETQLAFTNTPRLNPEFRTPYCVATVSAPTSLVSDPTTGQWLGDATAGDRLLVVAEAYGSFGTWMRVLLRSGVQAWVDYDAVRLSPGCTIFLAQAPGIPGEGLQCSVMFNAAAPVFDAPDSTNEPLFTTAIGDRFAALEMTTSATGRWYRIGTFGLSGDAWVKEAQTALTTGCQFSLAQTPPPPPVAACVIEPINAFVNVRSQPTSDGTYNGIVGQLFGATAPSGRDATGAWYRIDGGWVAGFLVQSTGTCTGLPIVAS